MNFLSQSRDPLAQLLELVMDELLDGILIVNDRTRKVAYFNSKFTDMWKIPQAISMKGDDHALLNHVVMQVVDPQQFLDEINRLHGSDETSNDEINFKDGRVFARKSIVVPDLDESRSRVWIFTDITSQKSIHIDSLTGCLNRKAWDSIGASDSVLGERLGQYCVAVVDLNDFKAINDDFGHEAGDRVLKRLGAALQRLIRNKHDKVFRTGGDEFCILLQSDVDVSSIFSKRLSDELITAGIYASHGVCMSSETMEILDAFRVADSRMLSAKKSQKKMNNAFIHSSQLKTSRKTKTDEEIEMQANLSVAIKKGELALVFQPIFGVDGRVAWIEALCRWTHDGQSVPPDVFIPLSESSDLIHRIWDWVLEESIKSIHAWNLISKSAFVSINFSAVQVEYCKNTGFSYSDQIKKICRKYNVSPTRLRIELTETSLLADLRKAREMFEELAAIGVGLCIDDFGTGFSSLSIMQALPIKCLKIDGSFVKGVPENMSSTAITKGTISMANELGFEVCAEWVESVEQVEFLRSCGCDYFQGYVKSRPLPADEVVKVL